MMRCDENENERIHKLNKREWKKPHIFCDGKGIVAKYAAPKLPKGILDYFILFEDVQKNSQHFLKVFANCLLPFPS